MTRLAINLTLSKKRDERTEKFYFTGPFSAISKSSYFLNTNLLHFENRTP